MKLAFFLSLGFLVTVFDARGRAQDLIRLGAFNNRDPVQLIAREKGHFKNESLKIEPSLVTNSVDLMRNFISGKSDIIHTNADNIIAWAEGQGEDPQPNDFIIFIGGSQGVRQRLIVAGSINSIGDLKGKVLAVDDPRTGYAPVLAYMLKQHGLVLGRDYTFKAIGNTRMRAEAISRGEAAGAVMSLSDDEIAKRGFRLLGKSEDYVQVYARGVGAARRPWANQNEALLVRYIRALIRSTDWLLDPRNKEEVLKLLLLVSENSVTRAEQMYEEAVDHRFGHVLRARIDMSGVKAIIELREAIGAMKQPLPSPEKYADDRYYKKALATLSQ
jgi:ABC-type nitrate/sulfonate/bicarbonate transport system substrate-binding protein